MLFQKSFVSFVAAIALATSVSASAIAARGIVPTCPSGLNPYCCDASLSAGNLPQGSTTSLTKAYSDFNKDEPVGQNCTPPSAQGCPDGKTPLCCPSTLSIDGVPYAPNCQQPSNAGSVTTDPGVLNKDPNGKVDGKSNEVKQ